MPYNTKKLLRDSQMVPIPQYYDPDLDEFKPMTKEQLVKITAGDVSDFRTANLSVTSTAAEITAGLTNRKQLIFYPPTTGGIKWGHSPTTAVIPLNAGDDPVDMSFVSSTTKVYVVSDGTNRTIAVVESK